jgi:hypothetical protein
MMSSLTRLSALLAGVVALATSSSGEEVSPKPFDPIGVWRSYHKDGTSFDVRLFADGTARSTADSGQTGIWRWEEKSVRIIFNDGWDDVVELGEDGQLIKRSWGPGADRNQPSKNVSRFKPLPRNDGARE